MLQVLPQFHVGGWNVQSILAWWKGARVVLERSFDAGRALELIESERVTTMMGVPANYLLMAGAPGFASADLSSLRLAVVGGAPMPVPLLDTWAERGIEIVQGYGLTEAAPNVLCLPPEDARRKAGSAGKPYPYVECRIAADGELLVCGPNVFAGYWRNPEATAAAFRDGWLLTGDVAERDDEGNYTLRGRIKELVVSGGENVYPAEVEAVLHDHPAVVEAAVVGVPDERWGEVCVAYVVTARAGRRGRATGSLRRAAREVQGAEGVPHGRRSAAQLAREGRQVGARSGGGAVTDVVTGAAGRPLSARGLNTRRKLLDAAERIFGELGYVDASIVKVTEAAGVGQGTFYLYFDSKRAIFDELVRDLNQRVRHAMKEGSSKGTTRLESELLGFQAYFRFTADHPALYRIIRQAEFVSPDMLHYHYDRLSEGYIAALREASESGEIASLDPEVAAWALMGLGELIGMRWILWGGNDDIPPHVLAELERIIRCVLEARG